MTKTRLIRLTSMLITALIITASTSLTVLASGYGNEEILGDTIWIGWTTYETGTTAYDVAGQDSGKLYGRFNFKAGDQLAGFFRYCIEKDPETYGCFNKYLGMSDGAMMEDRANIIADWNKVHTEDRDNFERYQDEYAYTSIYKAAKDRLMSSCGADLDSYNDPVLKGTVFSIALKNSPSEKGISPIADTYAADKTAEEWMSDMYAAEAVYDPAHQLRWSKSQKEDADMEEQALGYPKKSEVSAVTRGESGGIYDDTALNEWLLDHATALIGEKTITKDFLKEGWEERRQWAEILRTSVDFAEVYGIVGGSLAVPGGVTINLSEWGIDQVPYNDIAKQALVGTGIYEDLGTAGRIATERPRYAPVPPEGHEGESKRNSPGYCDCSSFVTYVYSAAFPENNIFLAYHGDNTAAGIAQLLVESGCAISRSKIQPGDFLFFTRSHASKRFGGIGHVAIYLGNGYVIDASSASATPQVGKRLKENLLGDGTFVLACRPYGVDPDLL